MHICKVGVIGAGTMGAGIALVCARSGYGVTLVDSSREALEKAGGYLLSVLDGDVRKGKITEQANTEIRNRIAMETEIAELSDCEMVIEAVSERLELKKSIFAALSAACRSDALLMTNTSSIAITEIASAVRHPKRVVGLHFFNPAPVMPLVEVIRGMASGDEEVERAIRFAESLGKTPVLAADTPGFIVNRVARPFYNEALRILGDRIATPEQIDRIMKQAGGFRMGPFELQDMIGIDINYATTESVYAGFHQEGRFRPSRIQQRMVQAGRLGRKTGGGFYDHE